MSVRRNVLIVGAGAAGLSAAQDLSASRVDVTVLEARDRIGGRIFTHHDGSAPFEFGAEFIHGKQETLFEILKRAAIPFYDATEHHWYFHEKMLRKSDAFWSSLNRIMQKMNEVGDRDLSFEEFLNQYVDETEFEGTKSLTTLFLEGFHASRIERIGVQGLLKANEASEYTDGDRSFRIIDGYQSIMHWLQNQSISKGARIELKTVVEEINWSKNNVRVLIQRNGKYETYEASCAIITVPLGVLQSGKIRFVPEISQKFEAAKKLIMGHVVKIIFQFSEAFWEDVEFRTPEGSENGYELGFIHAPAVSIPTWWTQLPIRVPYLVAWAGGSRAEKVLLRDEHQIIECALDSLSTIMGIPQKEIERFLKASHFHNWSIDPFTRGAYSYVPVDGLQAQGELGKPVESTLFFAGEATNTNGDLGTVHGAIATGLRAAKEVLRNWPARRPAPPKN